jgi:copper chaperone
MILNLCYNNKVSKKKGDYMNKIELPTIGVEQTAKTTTLTVENIKCGGCANTITKKLEHLKLSHIEVSPENGTVVFQTPAHNEDIMLAITSLRELGYPLVESEEGLKKMALKAKSYLSCAIGKMG